MPRFALPFFALTLAFLSAAPLLAAPVEPGSEHCVVNVPSDDRLNLREGPGTNAAILARLAYGSCGIVVTGACQGSWCPAEDGHYAGWVHRHYIAALPKVDFCFTAAASTDVRTIRAWPAPHSRALTELPAEQCGIRPLPYAVRDWQKVRAAGWEGWLPLSGLAHTGD
ncbi:SH3 domain-containing protein [Palleronia marisminoris]|uniref:Bacterial SH3 domain protein n=1 Tax=Palleronia marisminoris TaxID=315423 RepID=A0A1Y5SXH8_9RHOB|nr:SH3 domain-containing protein [Palleronia marisminoris]SFG96400.1 SH3 domain-containing protein [Palleronia marisminoris]SLN47368.1 Bacterial SH3 domain protein [Palleronia marisminoris]